MKNYLTIFSVISTVYVVIVIGQETTISTSETTDNSSLLENGTNSDDYDEYSSYEYEDTSKGNGGMHG